MLITFLKAGDLLSLSNSILRRKRWLRNEQKKSRDQIDLLLRGQTTNNAHSVYIMLSTITYGHTNTIECNAQIVNKWTLYNYSLLST